MRIAPAAVGALRAGSGWRILSLHTHAVNFVDSSGHLLSLTDDRFRMGPFSIEVELAQGGFPLAKTNDQLSFGEGAKLRWGKWTLDLASAEIWNPCPNWSRLRTMPWHSDFLPVLLARLRASSHRDSLACVVDLMNATLEQPGKVAWHDLPRTTAAAAALRVIQALGEADLAGISTASAALAGTGVGLTPSGDDFLIGIIFGIYATLPQALARSLARVILHASTGRTNRISQAWLAAAAEGQAIRAWHDLVAAILSGDRPSVDQASQNLIELGHTSGADALTGFAAYYLARARPLSANSRMPQLGPG